MTAWQMPSNGWRTFQPRTFQPQASTPDLSTPDFSTMNFPTLEFSTPDFSTKNFSTPDFSTPDFSTPDFQSWTFQPWILNYGVEKLGWLILSSKVFSDHLKDPDTNWTTFWVYACAFEGKTMLTPDEAALKLVNVLNAKNGSVWLIRYLPYIT